MAKLLQFVITLLGITFITFWLCHNSQVQPIEYWCASKSEFEDKTACYNSPQARFKMKEWHMDLPFFYMGIGTVAEPDTLYKIFPIQKQTLAQRLTSQYGNWREIQQVLINIQTLVQASQSLQSDSLKASNLTAWGDFVQLLNVVNSSSRPEEWENTLQKLFILNQTQPFPSAIKTQCQKVQNAWNLLKNKPTNPQRFLPKIFFYGLNNQYHTWIKEVLQGNFGKSYRSGQPVGQRIGEFIGNSLQMTLISFTIALILGILLGYIKTIYHKRPLDTYTDIVMFVLNVIPSFSMGILLVIVFANPHIFDWFLPAYNFKGAFWERATLPLIAYTYGSTVNIAYFVKEHVFESLRQDYVRTAKAKGVPSLQIYAIHIFKNILPPLLTVCAGIFPALMGGSVALEYVFSIGGMGQESYNAIQQMDTPYIMMLMLMTGLLTLLGYRLTDFINQRIDRRIR